MHSTIYTLLTALLTTATYAVPVPQPAEASCPTDGALICSTDGFSFFMCNWGKAVSMGSVASGTICKDGVIYAKSNGVPLYAPGYTSMPPPLPSSVLASISTAVPSMGTPVPVLTTPASVVPIITPQSITPSTSAAAMLVSVGVSKQHSYVSQTEQDQTTTSSTTILQTSVQTSVVYETRTRPADSSTSNPTTSTQYVTVYKTSTITTKRPTSTPVQITVQSSTDALIETFTASSASSTSLPAPASVSDITSAQILDIAPQSSSCDNAPFSAECATADHAAPLINAGFAKYGITTKGEKAAVLSLMAFESGEFKYNINHYPGRPGQGTRNMMNFQFILPYASSIPSLSSQIPSGTTADNASDNVKNTVRALVLDDDYSFASAAWFLSTQCSSTVRSGLQGGTDEASWESYITSCVGTTVTDNRKAYWTAAVAAL